jgi:hypothetical protein
MFRTFLVVALIIAAMVVIKDGRALEETGLLSSCKTVATPVGQTGYWEACRAGKLEGHPNLTRRSCTSHGVAGRLEYWRCPSPIRSGPNAGR